MEFSIRNLDRHQEDDFRGYDQSVKEQYAVLVVGGYGIVGSYISELIALDSMGKYKHQL